jgi:hypothetical protein
LRKEAGIYQLTSIKIMIATPEFVMIKKHTKAPLLSAKSCDTILEASDYCSYAPLKEALHHLARTKDSK